MADKIKMNIFQSEDSLIDAVVGSLISDLEQSIQSYGKANLLLSGGSTPGPIYKALDQKCAFIKDLKIGLVDERFVAPNNEFSNERLIKSCFTKLPSELYEIVGMVHDIEDEVKNIELLKTKYHDFIERTDVVILGMGPDGHTASIFPNDPQSDKVLSSNEKNVFSTKAPNHPEQRITCSLDMITNASSVYLIISGDEKLNVLENNELSLPIHVVLKEKNDIKIFTLEK
ncbi:MAG: 6-phosphogluconolactonase [Salibacteraceae bacterium]|jgi:6-phosphogluconolactonase